MPVFVITVINIFGSFKRRVEDIIDYPSDRQLLKNYVPWNCFPKDLTPTLLKDLQTTDFLGHLSVDNRYNVPGTTVCVQS